MLIPIGRDLIPLSPLGSSRELHRVSPLRASIGGRAMDPFAYVVLAGAALGLGVLLAVHHTQRKFNLKRGRTPAPFPRLLAYNFVLIAGAALAIGAIGK